MKELIIAIGLLFFLEGLFLAIFPSRIKNMLKNRQFINRVFSKDEINNYEDAMSCDTDKYANYFKLMLDMGIYLPPSQFECCFFSSVMTKADIKKIINSNRVALQKIA